MLEFHPMGNEVQNKEVKVISPEEARRQLGMIGEMTIKEGLMDPDPDLGFKIEALKIIIASKTELSE